MVVQEHTAANLGRMTPTATHWAVEYLTLVAAGRCIDNRTRNRFGIYAVYTSRATARSVSTIAWTAF